MDFGGVGGILGPLGGLLGDLGAVFGCDGAVLGRGWRRLGALLGPFGARPKGASWIEGLGVLDISAY